MDQLGFSFEEAAPSFVLAAPGTWDPAGLCATEEGHRARLDAALSALAAIPEPARALFAAAIAAERAGLAHQVARMTLSEGASFRLWGQRVRYSLEELQPFMDHCQGEAGARSAAAEYKVTTRKSMHVAAMFVPGVGTLVARVWPGVSEGLDFTLQERDTALLDAYDDGAPSISFPAGRRAESMCQRFCESGDTVPSAITNSVDGRRYVVTGTAFSGRGSNAWTADAWTLVPAAQWDGPTFTYRTLIQAYDAGTMQRGDHRGQLVKVRGVLCVLESYATLSGTDDVHVQRAPCAVGAGAEVEIESEACA